MSFSYGPQYYEEPLRLRDTGLRKLDCRFYDQCLRIAANRRWPSFTCCFMEELVDDLGLDLIRKAEKHGWEKAELIERIIEEFVLVTEYQRKKIAMTILGVLDFYEKEERRRRNGRARR